MGCILLCELVFDKRMKVLLFSETFFEHRHKSIMVDGGAVKDVELAFGPIIRVGMQDYVTERSNIDTLYIVENQSFFTGDVIIPIEGQPLDRIIIRKTDWII